MPLAVVLNEMTVTPFETKLYAYLTPFFAQYGYGLMPEKKQFRRDTASGFQNIVLSSVPYPDDTMLEVNFGCRNDQIEQIAQQFLNNLTEFRSDANTFLLSIGRFSGLQYARYRIHSEDELIHVCDQIELFFEQQGFEFMRKAGALAVIDQLLNDQPDQPCRYVYNQTHRCYKGLIAARLNHNPYFDKLVDEYRHSLVRLTQNSHEQIQFERLITFLHHYTAN